MQEDQQDHTVHKGTRPNTRDPHLTHMLIVQHTSSSPEGLGKLEPPPDKHIENIEKVLKYINVRGFVN